MWTTWCKRNQSKWSFQSVSICKPCGILQHDSLTMNVVQFFFSKLEQLYISIQLSAIGPQDRCYCRQPADRTVMLNAFFFFPINPWSLNRLLALVEIEYSQPFESKQSHRVANIIARELTVSVSPIYLNCFCFHRFTHTPFTIRPVPIVLGSFWATFSTFEQFFALLRYFWAGYRFRARKSWQFH